MGAYRDSSHTSDSVMHGDRLVEKLFVRPNMLLTVWEVLLRLVAL